MKAIKFYREQLLYEPIVKAWVRRAFKLAISSELIDQDIETLRLPTLIIAGEVDRMILLWHCQAYESKILGAQLEAVAGADHLLPSRHGERVSAFCHRFMNEINLILPKIYRCRGLDCD
jgi:pimeloyl-ACP methyl ester carboxylesterase